MPLEEALAELDTLGPDDTVSYQALAKKTWLLPLNFDAPPLRRVRVARRQGKRPAGSPPTR
jgi:hypothetical protein